ncbi:MAG: tripartite tricarboxylate transporter TctB family protein [Caldimonas sp.]
MPEPRRADRGAAVVALLLVLLAAAALWQSREFSPLGAIFPRTIAIALLIAGAIVAWRALRGSGPKSRGLPREGWIRGAMLIVILALWIGLLERVGFVPTGIVAFVAIAIVTGRDAITVGRLIRFVVVATVVVVAFQLLFVEGLKVQLPTGTWLAGTWLAR